MATSTPFLARLERFPSVDSTQRVVRDWLADGQPEVLVAVAAEQTAGRGRDGRSWVAPAGRALLLSVGFRPAGLAAGHAWRLGAIVSQAMIDAAEEAAGLRDGSLWLKWPNDIVV
ncbi:MAG: biotin--[acetyl-CoA-carboxylase] ligase, partial [Candidatus Limnocylindrales bacterium]